MGKTGYSRHPETLRWVGKLAALFGRHETLVGEMHRRGYSHHSPLDQTLAVGSATQDVHIDSFDRQIEILRAKPCDCLVNETVRD